MKIIGILIVGAILLLGCESSPQLNRQQVEAMEAYRQLPVATQQALEAKALRGYTFSITVKDLAVGQDATTELVSELSSQLLANGAYRAEKGQTPDFVCVLDNYQNVNTGLSLDNQVHVSMKDTKHDTSLIDGMYGDDVGLRRDLRKVISTLGTERANKELAKAQGAN